MRLIDAKRIIYSWTVGVDGKSHDGVTLQSIIDEMPTVKAVPLSEIYRVIAGHSDYHGDSILSALTCIAEGKEVNPIKPLEE